MVDELRSALELANEDELHGLTQLLCRPRFNPLDYLNAPDPIDLQSRDRAVWIETLDARFRFLAADGFTVLRRQSHAISYRDVLIDICRYLKIPYSDSLATTDIEAEIFLHLLGQSYQRLSEAERDALNQRVQRSLAKSDLSQPLPLSAQRDPVGWLLKGGSALAVSSVVRPLLLNQLARQFALHFAKHQLAREAVRGGAAAVAVRMKSYAALHATRHSMALSAARYTAARSALAVLGPALWAWFFADLGWRAIATSYARIIPTVFALAQIRLTREEACWVSA